MLKDMLIWTSQLRLMTVGVICVVFQFLEQIECGPEERSTEGSLVWQLETERWRRMTTSGDLKTSVGDAYHPHFYEKGALKNVTAQLGQTVYLHCVVRNLGDRTVSWIRRRDFHVLTVGETTYTAEERFEAVHMSHGDDWVLKIRLAELADQGDYECQVNTHPLMSYFVHLTVLVPEAGILGERDLLVSSGSYINLTCIIRQSPSPPVFVFWYHNDRMINYDSSRGKITLQKASEDTAMSTLYIKNAKASDSGNYTCGPSNAGATSVLVHVVNGQKPAAMQHDADSTSATDNFTRSTQFFISLACTLFVIQWSS
ncbi:zwei Ig domain protein zig-8-like [Limulus polyphemus]|uniref:Zwei Ig domain protein zig-8-like n=1 Tax=Limulus polyphemus TaxID=6850 RepID=A0ABM1S438_LIMPO|nr:zwei Ig domain protein zig-8-like [Limulus polyphemus]XP_022238395.1 zwei Ig domain protein zig-8-like [Limulus polyphemus]